jgi:integrase/recombinase XerD
MFDQIFSLPHVINRYRVGPLAEERLRYLAHCAEQQMSRWMLRTIARYTLIAASVLRLSKRPGAAVSRGEVKAKVDRWLACRSRRSTDRQVRRLGVRFTNHVVRSLAFLERLRPTSKVQQPYADHLSKFLDSARERGLSPQTIATYDWVLRRFLAEIANLRLRALTVVQLDKLLIKQFHDDGYARHTVRNWASVLRAFLRFAEERGWCRQGLAAAIMAPRVYAHEGLPIGPSCTMSPFTRRSFS